MNQQQYVVGLDIGTTKVACLVGVKNEHGKLEIIGRGVTESTGVQRGVVTNLAKTTEAIIQAAAMARADAGVDFSAVQVGIAGQHIRSMQQQGMAVRNNPTEVITVEEINELIIDQTRVTTGPGEEIIHVLPQEFTIDNERGITDPIGMAGSKIQADFHIIIGNVSAIQNIHRCVRDAGLTVNKLILEPLASSESVLTEEEKEAGIALVDIGGGTTDIAIFKDGIIRHTAVIPLGGNIITEDIKKGCLILGRHAESLKVNYGSAIADEQRESVNLSIPGLKGRDAKEIPSRMLARIIEARMTEIIENVYYEIRNSGYGNSLIGGIKITGGGAALRHAKQLFQYKTAMETTVGHPDEHITVNEKSNLTGPAFATGIGLVIMGYENKQDRVLAPQPEIESAPEQTAVPENPKMKTSFFERIMNLLDENEK